MEQSTPAFNDPQVALQAKNMTKAIFQTESGGDFNAKGKSGESGAGQWVSDTWKAQAQDVLGDGNAPMTPQNQSVVAQGTVRKLISQGKNAAQIAATWNSGSDQNWENKVGINKYGVHYNVPKYVKSVTDAYQTLKNGGQVNADPNNPSSTAAPQPKDESPSIGGFAGNVLSSAGNFVGGVANAVMHPIKTVEGIGSIVAGGVEKLIPGQQGQEKNFDAVVDFYKQRYGGSSIEEVAKHILHTAYTDPVGAAADASVLLSGGAAIAGKVGAAADLTEALRIADAGGSLSEISAANKASTASKVASGLVKAADYTNPITAPGKIAGAVNDLTGGRLGKAAGLVGKAAATPLGISTGVGTDPIVAGFKATSAGGDARQAFVEGLRGKAGPEELVSQAKDALGQVVSQRSQNYQSMLSKLGGDPATYDISPIIQKVDQQLKNFNITKAADGSLDFSRATIGEGADATKIQQVYDDLKSWGTKPGDRTAMGIDTLKRRIGNYYSPNSDIRSFITATKGATKQVLEKAPGYSEAMKNYAEFSDQIDEARRSLSLGDKALEETSFKKLTSSLKNNDTRRQIIQELDQATGGNLLSKVAGQRFSSIAPRGITAAIEAGAGTAGGIVAGAGGILPLLGLAMTTSPRLVGEFINALGLGAYGTTKVMQLLSRFKTPVVVGGKASGLINR